MPIKESELILNQDGSVYHLNLKPADIADTIIFVGDQDRVAKISKHFDTIDIKKQKRNVGVHTRHSTGSQQRIETHGIWIRLPHTSDLQNSKIPLGNGFFRSKRHACLRNWERKSFQGQAFAKRLWKPSQNHPWIWIPNFLRPFGSLYRSETSKSKKRGFDWLCRFFWNFYCAAFALRSA